MERQRSFAFKPIRSLALSITVCFSFIFAIFFLKTAPLSRLSRAHNLVLSSTPIAVSKEVNTSSSEYLLKDSILAGAHLASDEISPQASSSEGEETNGLLTGNSSLASFSKNASYSANEGEETKGLLTGNSSLAPFSKNASYSANSSVVGSQELGHEMLISGGSVSNKSGDEGFQELNGVIGTDSIVQDNTTSVKHNIASDMSFGSRINIVKQTRKVVSCDITKGRWVYDESYPLYTNVTCPFIDEGFSCEANGRLDKDYMKWRWQPQDCDIPRFNATRMLELIRGKRLVFVGDSLNRNQWESMLCLLMGAVKDPKKVYEARGRKITKEKGNYCFKFEDYKCTVEFYVSHFLVHESKARLGNKRVQTLRIDTIDKGSSRWRRADFLVFNTAHWWSHSKTKAGINYYQERDQVHPQLDVTKAFRRALLTWASWVDKYINPRKTHVFFRSSAPSHFSGGLWNTGGHCREAFWPINTTFTSNYPEKNLIVEDTIRQMKKPVTFLNITRLSDYRPDAHPSIYGRKSVNRGVQDCSHWCLPGVPDNWNELLYYHLLLRTKNNFVD